MSHIIKIIIIFILFSKLATTVEANVVQGNSTLTLPFPVKTIKQESKMLPKIALVTNVTDEPSLQSGDNNKIPWKLTRVIFKRCCYENTCQQRSHRG